jgi:hypothetical protein
MMETIYMLNVQETGQTFPMPAGIGASDELIKRSLAAVIPYIDTAKLERTEKDGVTTITVAKSHAPKGAGDSGSFFAALITSLIESGQDGANPVIRTFLELEQVKDEIHAFQPHQMLELKKRLEAAFRAGEQRHEALKDAVQLLVKSAPQPAKCVPAGF